MKFRFERCLAEGKILSVPIDPARVGRELTESERDLAAAERSLSGKDMKWVIIQAYYAQFHALRALVFRKGYREKSHSCLKYAVEALLVDSGLIEGSILEDFTWAMKMREGADYGAEYDEKVAKDVLEASRRILARVRELS